MSIYSMYTILVIHKVMLFQNRKPALIICLRCKVWLPQREQGEQKDRTLCPEKQPTSLFSILLYTAVVSALKRVELLLGDLLYPLCSWNFSQAEKSFYISNSIKLNSKALISVFSTTLLLTMGLFPGANPTTSTSNTLSQAAGQHDLSGSSCKPSLSISLISAVSIWLEHPFVSSRIPPLCWATVCAVGQSWELMQPKSKHVFHSLLAWLSWV